MLDLPGLDPELEGIAGDSLRADDKAVVKFLQVLGVSFQYTPLWNEEILQLEGAPQP